MGVNSSTDEQFTLSKRGSGQLIGWISLLRASPTEFVQASTDCQVLAISTKSFTTEILSNSSFREYLAVFLICMKVTMFQSIESLSFQTTKLSLEDKLSIIGDADVLSIDDNFDSNALNDKGFLSSTPEIVGYPVGSIVTHDVVSDLTRENFTIPIRLITFKTVSKPLIQPEIPVISSVTDEAPADLYSLGILEDDHLNPDQKFPIITTKSDNYLQLAAVVEMICLYYNVPFRRDAVKSIISDQKRRSKEITVETNAGLLEFLGFTCQIGNVNREYFTSVESPAVFVQFQSLYILWFKNKCLLVVSPALGFQRIPLDKFLSDSDESIVFALPRRASSTPNSKFGWSWFTLFKEIQDTTLSCIHHIFIGSVIWTSHSLLATNYR